MGAISKVVETRNEVQCIKDLPKATFPNKRVREREESQAVSGQGIHTSDVIVTDLWTYIRVP